MTRINRLIASVYGWACERLYHELAWTYDIVAWGVSGGAWDSWRRTALDFIQGTRVLELGAGTGHLAQAGNRRGLQWIGLELSPNMLAQAQRHVGAAGNRSPLVHAHAEWLPLADNSFHTVVATFPAPFILASRTLRECRRVLDGAEGRFVIVGLWVLPNWARQFPLPVLYGHPSEALTQHVTAALLEAGFDRPALITVDVAGAKVGVLVAKPKRAS